MSTRTHLTASVSTAAALGLTLCVASASSQATGGSQQSAQPSGVNTLSRVSEQPASGADISASFWSDRLAEQNAMIQDLNTRTRAAELAASGAENFVWRLGAVGSVGGALIAILGYFKYRASLSDIQDKLAASIQDETRERVEAKFNRAWADLASQMAQQAENDLLRFTEFLSLAHSRQYEAALECLDLSDSELLQSLDEFSPAIRRAVIECLAPSKDFSSERLDIAWQAANRLLDVDSSPKSLALFMKVAVRSREYERGFREFSKHGLGLRLDDKDCNIWAATLLRRLNRPDEALNIVRKYSSFDECIPANTVASLHRDQGDFAAAYDILRPQMLRLMKRPPRPLPEGWQYVVNSYIASCSDRRCPEEAIDSIRFLLQHDKHPTAIFNCLNLAVELPTNDEQLKSLFPVLANSVEFLEENTNGIRCRAMLREMKTDIRGAIAILEDTSRARAEQSKHSRRDTRDNYFLTCHLARLYIKSSHYGKAINAMIPLTAAEPQSAEAEYFLAKGYLLDHQEHDGVSWLARAFSCRKYWLARARRDSDIGELSPVVDLIAKQQQELNQQEHELKPDMSNATKVGPGRTDAHED